MTKKKLKAGRELDLLVAEKVMGYHWEEWETGRGFYAPDGAKVAKRFKKDRMRLVICEEDGSECVPTRPLPYFSSSITDAWEVVMELRRRYGAVAVDGINDVKRPGKKNEHSDVTFWECTVQQSFEQVFESAGTAELAICLTALKVVEGKEKTQVKPVKERLKNG